MQQGEKINLRDFVHVLPKELVSGLAECELKLDNLKLEGNATDGMGRPISKRTTSEIIKDRQASLETHRGLVARCKEFLRENGHV